MGEAGKSASRGRRPGAGPRRPTPSAVPLHATLRRSHPATPRGDGLLCQTAPAASCRAISAAGGTTGAAARGPSLGRFSRPRHRPASGRGDRMPRPQPYRRAGVFDRAGRRQPDAPTAGRRLRFPRRPSSDGRQRSGGPDQSRRYRYPRRPDGLYGGGAADILALRPAPIQAANLGYPGTSGAPFMDYMIADAVVVPPGADSIFSEAVVRLSRCYQPADRKLEIASETPTRAAEGLPPDGTVFCCFNNGFKLGPEIFALWLRLLAAVPNSVLWLLESNSVMPGRLRKIASEAAIAPGRLIFAPRRDRPHHLARQRLADLFLDTTPYGAHTTASDALRLCVPVITCPGPTFASRVAASLLGHLGLPELIARDLEHYEIIARSLALDV